MFPIITFIARPWERSSLEAVIVFDVVVIITTSLACVENETSERAKISTVPYHTNKTHVKGSKSNKSQLNTRLKGAAAATNKVQLRERGEEEDDEGACAWS